MKKILFICIENSCRSQMAEGFANFYGKDKLAAYSAGSKPSGKVNNLAIKVMAEKGIDISGAKSKGFNELLTKEFDYVVGMGCKDACPLIPAKNHIEWNISDPKGKDIAFFRKTRDGIEAKVRKIT